MPCSATRASCKNEQVLALCLLNSDTFVCGILGHLRGRISINRIIIRSFRFRFLVVKLKANKIRLIITQLPATFYLRFAVVSFIRFRVVIFARVYMVNFTVFSKPMCKPNFGSM